MFNQMDTTDRMIRWVLGILVLTGIGMIVYLVADVYLYMENRTEMTQCQVEGKTWVRNFDKTACIESKDDQKIYLPQF